MIARQEAETKLNKKVKELLEMETKYKDKEKEVEELKQKVSVINMSFFGCTYDCL